MVSPLIKISNLTANQFCNYHFVCLWIEQNVNFVENTNERYRVIQNQVSLILF